jgi:hypothetical protein
MDMDTTNEPVAWMLLRNEVCVELTEWFGVMRGWEDFLGDNEKIVELYTHPVKELDEQFKKGFEAGKEEGWKVHKFHHPVKELTDEEILCLWDWWSGEILSTDILDFADTYKRVLLGEEGLLEWHKEYVKKMNEQLGIRKAQEK